MPGSRSSPVGSHGVPVGTCEKQTLRVGGDHAHHPILDASPCRTHQLSYNGGGHVLQSVVCWYHWCLN